MIQEDLNNRLIMACIFDKYEIAKYLLEKGADPKVKEPCGSTLIELAIENGNFDLEQLLIEYGAKE